MMCREKIQQQRQKSTRYTICTQKVPSLLLCERSKCTDHKLLVTLFYKRHSNTMTETTTKSIQDIPIPNQDHIQTWTISIHNRMAVQTKPEGKQRCTNTWYATKY